MVGEFPRMRHRWGRQAADRRSTSGGLYACAQRARQPLGLPPVHHVGLHGSPKAALRGARGDRAGVDTAVLRPRRPIAVPPVVSQREAVCRICAKDHQVGPEAAVVSRLDLHASREPYHLVAQAPHLPTQPHALAIGHVSSPSRLMGGVAHVSGAGGVVEDRPRQAAVHPDSQEVGKLLEAAAQRAARGSRRGRWEPRPRGSNAAAGPGALLPARPRRGAGQRPQPAGGGVPSISLSSAARTAWPSSLLAVPPHPLPPESRALGDHAVPLTRRNYQDLTLSKLAVAASAVAPAGRRLARACTASPGCRLRLSSPALLLRRPPPCGGP
mmetsp:Transcript_51133/g.158547  ORF Transcript_51133/g.158547 Transcript_51133/m.158547 type:complete len:327 (-) Transcript_51133:255-1235(-)